MKKFIPLLLLSFVLLFSACSSNSDKQAATESEQAMQTRTIHVYGLDQMKFAVKEKTDGVQVGDSVKVNDQWYHILTGINAAPGEEIDLTLTTVSKLPPSTMSHNWLLLKNGTDAQAFVNASLKAKDNDYVAPDMMDQVIKETGLVAGGESKTITFSAPEETGEYDYICTFPGHFSGGMKGIMTVAEMSNTDTNM